MNAEGWYRDPFELHSDRWFSDGKPTNVVRDGDVDSYDEPPVDHWGGSLVEIDDSSAHAGDDLRRSDDPTSPRYSNRDAVCAAIDTAAASGLGFS